MQKLDLAKPLRGVRVSDNAWRTPIDMSIEAVVLAGYVSTLGLLFAFSLRQAVLAQALRVVQSRPAVSEARPPSRQLPTVTIQLPIYNERYVAGRVIDAVAAIDYPRERLSVQVLDDSTDVTTRIIASAVARYSAGGLDISHVRRGNRDGYKAGALCEGLRIGTGELVAIFDADFVPAPDVLAALVPPFEDPGVAAVQARWGYLNEAESTLTRLQAFLLDLHFRLEQPARYAAGLS